MSACNCSGCPHAANCACVCPACQMIVRVLPPTLGVWIGRRWEIGLDGKYVPMDEPPSLGVAEGPVAEQFDEPQIVHDSK